MKFMIRSVVLWAKKANTKPRVLQFEPNAVNIITGASRTGKSAIIPIIDYCLGSGKCTIPVSVIRDACSWFGVLFELEDEQMLICRREPGENAATGDMFILREKHIDIPETISKNITLNSIKDMLNELFGMSFNDLDPNLNVYHPSYRDFMAFIFQPQNIIANADVLFYKADTMEHRKKLIDVFPYALGAVTPEILAKRKEIERLTKLADRYERELGQIRNVAEVWRQEVAGWLIQAHKYGLTNYTEKSTDDFSYQLNELKNVSRKQCSDSAISTEGVMCLSEDIVALRKEEQIISRDLYIANKRRIDMLQLKHSMGDYDRTLRIQLDRLEISNWLRSCYTERAIIPLFKVSHDNAVEELDALCEAVKKIEATTTGMSVVPAAFEREFQIVEQRINELTENLSAIQKRIEAEEESILAQRSETYTLESVSRFLGRIETAIETYERISDDSDLSEKLETINERIAELKEGVKESEINRKQKYALSYIQNEMGRILTQLDVEHPEDPVELVIKDLTVRVKNSTGRDDYLWEIGSASNWLSYHISLILALQYYFQTKSSVNVPNFIVFDQPSQVYFPRTREADDEHYHLLKDDDKNAVKKIFETLSEFVKNAGFDIQIIVTEHAEDDIWGEQSIPGSKINKVERWRDNMKLVPEEWLE